MSIILHQRNYLVLHGSSVNLPNGAVGFIGDCGQGKSTIAFAMTQKGYPLVSDDVLAIRLDQGSIRLYPSFYEIKLNMDIVENSRFNIQVSEIDSGIEKTIYNAVRNFSLNAVTLKRIYILKIGKKNKIQSMKSQNKLIELIKNTYPKSIFGKNEKISNLIQCAKFVRNIDIKQLELKHSLEDIGGLIKIIVNDNLF